MTKEQVATLSANFRLTEAAPAHFETGWLDSLQDRCSQSLLSISEWPGPTLLIGYIKRSGAVRNGDI